MRARCCPGDSHSPLNPGRGIVDGEEDIGQRGGRSVEVKTRSPAERLRATG